MHMKHVVWSQKYQKCLYLKLRSFPIESPLKLLTELVQYQINELNGAPIFLQDTSVYLVDITCTLVN